MTSSGGADAIQPLSGAGGERVQMVAGPGTESHEAPGGAMTALRRTGRWIEHELERPGIAAIVVGGSLIAAAAVAGLSETIVGAAGGYLVYRIVKRAKARKERAG